MRMGISNTIYQQLLYFRYITSQFSPYSVLLWKNLRKGCSPPCLLFQNVNGIIQQGMGTNCTHLQTHVILRLLNNLMEVRMECINLIHCLVKGFSYTSKLFWGFCFLNGIPQTLMQMMYNVQGIFPTSYSLQGQLLIVV